jgi:hypothetical protein
MLIHTEPGVSVRISADALERAAKENLLNVKRARLHEIYAGCACVVIVVSLTGFFVDALARGLA